MREKMRFSAMACCFLFTVFASTCFAQHLTLSHPLAHPAGNPHPSIGCSRAAPQDVAQRWLQARRPQGGWVTLEVVEPSQRSGPREVWAALPAEQSQRAGKAMYPLLLFFHGQTGRADATASRHQYLKLGHETRFLTVYPQGLDDHTPKGQDNGSGWNVGTGGDNSTCVVEGKVPFTCYESCTALNQCGPCNWIGCHDEPSFVRKILDEISSIMCVDLSRLYIAGVSNGGMLVHHLVQQMPGTFAAAVPWYGQPLLGYGLGGNYELLRDSEATRQTAMLQLHGRQDAVIPIAGGVSSQGWIYEPLRRIQSGWAAIHGCTLESSPVSTMWDGGKDNFACEEHLHCFSGKRVMRCLYDGDHGQWPAGNVSDDATVWFMLQFRNHLRPFRSYSNK